MNKVTDLYLEYANQITDAPTCYARWLAYLLLSSTINKNIFMRGAFRNVFPNFYFLVIGPSSVFRKSFSQEIVTSLLREIHPEFELMDFSSRESFISELAREDRTPYGCGLIAIDEFSGFMARMRKSAHLQGFMQDISTMFTATAITRRVGVDEEHKKIYRINEPFLNMTAACSFDWLTKSIETSDLSGGFLARFLWIVANEKEKPNWSESRLPDPTLKSRLIDALREVQNVIGEMKWSDEAKSMWDSWYDDFRKRNQGGQWDANYERMTVQAKKMAMLHAAQETRLVISSADLDDAITLIETLVEPLKTIAIGDTHAEIMQNKIYGYIRLNHAKQISRSDLLNNIRGLDSWNLGNYEKTLTQMEKIEMVQERRKSGRPVLVYRLKS